MKITIGETSINYIAKNIDLKVVKDSTERLICNFSTCGVKECDVRETVFSDGTNNYYKVIPLGHIKRKTKLLGKAL